MPSHPGFPSATPNTAKSGAVIGHVTPVGAYTVSASPCGTFDHGGNVFQWSERIVSSSIESFRGVRGGSWDVWGSFLAASDLPSGLPGNDTVEVGFRVASLVPEPGTGVLLMAGVLGAAITRRTSRRSGPMGPRTF